MPFRNIPQTQHQYALIAFDSAGNERRDDPDGVDGVISGRILKQAAQDKPTHVFLFSHGWKGDLHAAIDQYDRWIKAMLDRRDDLAKMGGGFRPLWIGLHWPSLPWGESEFGDVSFEIGDAGDAAEGALSPEQTIDVYADRLDVSENTEARQLIRKIVEANQQDAAATEMPPDVAAAYGRLAELAGYEAKGLGAAPDEDNEPFDPVARFEAGNAAGVDFAGGGLLGGLLGPLRQLSFWRMKKRARTVGEGGMHDFVARLMNTLPQARFHLMGHSFGCIVMSSILGGKNGSTPLPRPVDSVALVQGALSLWAYATKVPGESGPGYFHHMLRRAAVRGPVVTTQSTFDRAVRICYPVAVAAVLSSASFDVDSLPTYGAIGTFGIQGLDGATSLDMLDEQSDYQFQAGKIYNVESSQFIRKGGGASGAHSDIDGPQVAHLLWQVARV